MMNESKEEIMEATYRALCSHGYADLTIEKIAMESEKGKSLIYYHYEDKEDLMGSFLEYMGRKLEDEISELEDLPAEEKLDELLDLFLDVDDGEMWEFHKALSELRVQTHHNSSLAEKFLEIDSYLTDTIAETMKDAGVQEPDLRAEIMASAMEGALTRKIRADDREGLKEVKKELKSLFDF